MDEFFNMILFRHRRMRRWLDRFRESLESEAAEEFLQALLNVMRLAFVLKPDFRCNIKKFDACYQFASRDGKLTVVAEFRDGKMKVREGQTDRSNIVVIFKNGRSLINFLLAPNPDILNSILKQEITLDGNLNYLYRFAFMAKRLQLMALGEA